MQQEEQTERIIYLISQAVNGTISEDGLYELEEWKNSNPANGQLYGQLMDTEYRAQKLRDWDSKATEDELVRLNARMDSYQRNRRFSYAIAASILAALAAISIYFFVLRSDQQKIYTGESLYRVAGTIAPGGNRATLTLADGKVIDLAQAQHGTIAQQDGTSISKNADGEIIYQPQAAPALNNSYNTIQTPKGGRYTLRLPDGSKVWLNAASSLRYPASMSQAQRVVELSGEAYFEVTHDKARPFIVKTAIQQIQVLGTHFNVNSYADDANTNTTLLEGSVNVTSLRGTKQSGMLKPGQQAQTAANGETIIAHADTELATAWKDGRLQFREMPLKDMMRLVARWYNLEISYEGNIPNEAFTGNLPNGSSLTVLLKILAASHINFELRQHNNNSILILKP